MAGKAVNRDAPVYVDGAELDYVVDRLIAARKQLGIRLVDDNGQQISDTDERDALAMMTVAELQAHARRVGLRLRIRVEGAS